jgi:hypothetical protein
MNEIRPPSGFRIENVMTAWLATRESLLESDPSLEHDEAALTEILGPVQGDAEEILARVLRAKVHAEAMAKAADEQADLIVARKRRYLAREEAMKGLAMTIMEVMGKKKVELGDLTASVAKGRLGVHISDVNEVPDIYVEVVTERKPDKATIKSAIEAGHDVPGAALKNGADYLTIRKG